MKWLALIPVFWASLAQGPTLPFGFVPRASGGAGLSIVQVQVTTEGASSYSYSYPTTPISGNMLLVAASCRGATSIALPSGFTTLYSNAIDTNDGRSTTTIGWHTVGSSEANSYAITLTGCLALGSTSTGIVAYEITGQSGSPINGSADNLNISSTGTTPSVTPSVVGTLALGIGAVGDSITALTVSSGWTSDGYTSTGGNYGVIMSAHQTALTTDTTTPISVTFASVPSKPNFGATILVH